MTPEELFSQRGRLADDLTKARAALIVAVGEWCAWDRCRVSAPNLGYHARQIATAEDGMREAYRSYAEAEAALDRATGVPP